MSALIRAVDELLQTVADPGYKVDSFTFQPLREARRAMLPSEPTDCTDPTCGGFLAVPQTRGVRGCTAPDCYEAQQTQWCNGTTGGADDCSGCSVCSPCRCDEGGLCLSTSCDYLGDDQ
jgi:hypothetical protein